jgi:TM2 domain-containing membrane protein YozV
MATFCGNCGGVLRPIGPRNAGLAAVLSFLWTGLGQVYNGQIMKGVLLAVFQAINVALMGAVIGCFTWPIVWIFGMYDAYRTAERLNARGPFE